MIGNCKEFLDWAKMRFRYIDKKRNYEYKSEAESMMVDLIDHSDTRSYVFLEFHYHFGLDHSKIIIELFDDACPKTCKNFRELCEGYKRNDGKVIGYKHTRVERIVKD